MKRRWIGYVLLLLLAGVAAGLCREAWRERKFRTQIRAAAQRYGVDPLLVKAVVWRESGYNATARGTRGEIGLMQVQETAAREWADAERIVPFVPEHRIDPGTNTLAGTFYLGKLLKRYAGADNPLPYALADYNAGRANVLKWNTGSAVTNSALFIEQIRFVSTRHYVKSVLRRYQVHKFLARLGWS